MTTNVSPTKVAIGATIDCVHHGTRLSKQGLVFDTYATEMRRAQTMAGFMNCNSRKIENAVTVRLPTFSSIISPNVLIVVVDFAHSDVDFSIAIDISDVTLSNILENSI